MKPVGEQVKEIWANARWVIIAFLAVVVIGTVWALLS